MATKSIDKTAKKARTGKSMPEKKAASKAKEAAGRRPASAASKPASRPSTQVSSKAPAARPSAAPKPASTKPVAVKAGAVKPATAKAKPPVKAQIKAQAKPVASKTAAAKPAPQPLNKPDLKKSATAAKPAGKSNPAAKKGAEKSAAQTTIAKSAKAAAANMSTVKNPEKRTDALKSKSASQKSAPAAKTQPEKKSAEKNPAQKKTDPNAGRKPSAPAQAEVAGKKPVGKVAKNGAGAKTMTESPAMKKPLVGQKPRSDRPASMALGAPLTFMPKASQSVNESPPKSSPASQEAKLDFKVNDHVVYPAHGVGRIVGIERQVIAGIVNELFLIDFEQEKMKLRVPTAKAKAVGMRALSEPALVKKAIETLKGRARIKRTMWSRRAQEYEAKINSGDILSVAEVVRDLFRASDQPEQSYSERQLFEAALDRLAREVAAVHKSDLAGALAELDGALQQKKAA